MIRIPLIEPSEHPEAAELIDRIRSERDGKLLKLYRVLLHSQPLTEGWLRFFSAIRREAALPDRDREMVTLLVAHMTRSAYEYEQHLPYALKAGLTQQQVDSLPKWRESELFDERDRTILEYAESMTRDIQVPDGIFEAVSRVLDSRSLVELTATIAGYNMVSRFLEALRIVTEG